MQRTCSPSPSHGEEDDGLEAPADSKKNPTTDLDQFHEKLSRSQAFTPLHRPRDELAEKTYLKNKPFS